MTNVADKIFACILEISDDDMENAALNALAKALAVSDEEESDAQRVGSEDAAREAYRTAYGAEAYDAREEWLYDWFVSLSAERLAQLARHRRNADDVLTACLRAAAR